MSPNPPVSDISFELKHRIVGALILIIVGVVVVPMILSGPKPAADPIESDAAGSNPDTKVFVSKITPISGATPTLKREIERSPTVAVTEAASGAKPKPMSAPSPTGSAARRTTVAKATKRQSQAAEEKTGGQRTSQKTNTTASSKPAAKTQNKGIDRGWIVRIGTYSRPENAARIVKSLTALGFETSSERMDTSRGVLTRVWVGPYAQRVEAGRARSRIQQKTGEKGLIVAFP